jgi:dUTP pyrophosphatase
MKTKLKIKKLTDNAKIPIVASDEAAGLDFVAIENGSIEPGQIAMIRTGLAIQIEKGYWGLARSRSGNAAKRGVDICSSCVVDSDYRGELIFPLINHTKDKTFYYQEGDRIGQMVIVPKPEVEIDEVDELEQSQRGTGGFGSTGVK